MAKQAPVAWAQREDCVFLTVEVSDVKDPKVEIKGNSFSFYGKGGPGQEDFKVDIDLYGEIDPDQSKQRITGRNVFFNLKKKESGPYWPQLTKEKVKYPWLHVDFEKWKDEDDEEDEAAEPNLGEMGDMSALMQQLNASGMDMSNMPDMGGSGDAEAEEDSDDDDIPGLEDEEGEGGEKKGTE